MKNEIRWTTKKEYVDLETGEQLTEEEVKQKYTIINKKKKSYVYRETGTTTYTIECRRSQQGNLF